MSYIPSKKVLLCLQTESFDGEVSQLENSTDDCSAYGPESTSREWVLHYSREAAISDLSSYLNGQA